MNLQSPFQSIWEYEVQEEFRGAFIEAYNSDGLWVSLFKRCDGYISTEFKQDVENPNRFLTIDTWQSSSAFSAMKQLIGADYEELDRKCAAYTSSEEHLGFFSDE